MKHARTIVTFFSLLTYANVRRQFYFQQRQKRNSLPCINTAMEFYSYYVCRRQILITETYTIFHTCGYGLAQKLDTVY